MSNTLPSPVHRAWLRCERGMVTAEELAITMANVNAWFPTREPLTPAQWAAIGRGNGRLA